MRIWISIATLSLIVAGCSTTTGQPVTTTEQTTSAIEQSTPGSVTTTSKHQSSEICLSGDLPFDNDGLVAALGDDQGDATSIYQIRWDTSATCERVTIIFGTPSGAPAMTLGPSSVSVIPYAGIVRAIFPEMIDSSAIADTVLEGSLVDTIYVVRERDGAMFLDIHGTEEIPLEARAFTTTSPATLVIDVARADTSATTTGVTSSDTVVISAPTSGANQYPLDVVAYVEPALGGVHVQLIDSDEIVTDRSISLSGGSDTWQSLSTTIEEGPLGTTVLFIGTLNGDGEPERGSFVSLSME